jgi:membrane-bound lytic murein transglycosylase D
MQNIAVAFRGLEHFLGRMMLRRNVLAAAAWSMFAAASVTAQEPPEFAPVEAPQPLAPAPAEPAVIVPELAAPTPGETVAFPPPSVDKPLPNVVVDRPADDGFPRYASLKPAVAFWTRVFSEYSEEQSVIHSTEYPHKVFTVLDFRGDATRMDDNSLDKLRSREERAAKTQVEELLRKVDAKRNNPSTLTADERRVFDLFADVQDDSKFKRMRGTIRAQRGLKERTQNALQTSDHYLPEMERIFASYQLPKALTRLPLVESSFNVDAYSKVGAAGLWQFIPASARIYMRLNEVVDDRRDPWTSTDAAARHLRDDYRELNDWPLAITAYNHGRGGIARGLRETGGSTLPDLIRGYHARTFGFASKNFYAEFIAAVDVERANRARAAAAASRKAPLQFEVVETQHYVPYETLRRMCGADDALFRRLNPAYRPEVIEGKLYVPPGHLIRVPAGTAKSFEIAYAKLGDEERFDAQRAYYLLHKVARGDRINKIARRYDVSQSSILAANGLKGSAKLRVGQVLRIPPHTETRPGPVTVALGESTPQQTRAQKVAEALAEDAFRIHRVQPGQTLASIARRYKVTIASLREANDLGKSSLLKVGMKLKVPVAS